MKPRLILALLYTGLALVILSIRYAPARVTVYAIGDPVDHLLLAGFLPPEREIGQLVRRTPTVGTLHIPLFDARGAWSATLRLRSEQAGISVLGTNGQTLSLPTTSTFRHYAVFAPHHAKRSLSITLAAQSGGAVIVDEVVATGRGGWASPLDLIALLLIAAIPALLMVLTVRLPLDWAAMPSLLVLCVMFLLPVVDYAAWLTYGPLATLGIGLLAAMPWARARPTCALIILLGAGLRWYALGWGSGHVFHPEEQAVARNGSDSMWLQFLWGAGRLLRLFAGDAPAKEGWSLVLIGRGWSATLGTALIGVVYLLSAHLLRPRWALLATAFVACAPVLVQQSHMAVQAQGIILLVALLLLTSTLVVVAPNGRASLASVALSGVLLYSAPAVTGWLVAPLAAQLIVRRHVRSARPVAAVLVMLLLLGNMGSSNLGVVLAGDPASATAGANSGRPAYIYPLFNILLWGLGPLLMQLGVVGWGVGMIQALQQRRDRKWLPLLTGGLAAFVVAGRGPSYSLNALLPLVPALCLTAALLLQTFSQRLRFSFGQRTLRLLAGTALVLALATAVGLINVYRGPDPRVEASRWLITHVGPDDTLRTDPELHGQLPLGAAEAYRAAPLDPDASTLEELHAYAAMIADTDYFVTTLDRDDIGLDRLQPGHTRLDVCTYAALFDGRLGFVERASFDAQLHIAAWTMDDRRADSVMHSYDHPQLHIFQKIVTPSSTAIEQMLRC